MLKFTPAVFAVENSYQIMVPVTEPSLFWVEIDGKCYYDEQNGIMRSLCTTHRVTLPMHVLDKAGEYTVCERAIIDRTPYFPKTADTVKTTFKFRPIPNDNIRIYHIADAHNKVEEPIAAAKKFGDIDLLILNGDVQEDSREIAYFDTIYKIAEEITGGNIPIVFSRGNHDMRGYFAEAFAEYTPNRNGNTYYSFRLGSVWGLVLDCGEDKEDDSIEYGLTVACHPFRERETEYIKEVIKNAESEFSADGIEHKIVISHNPFTIRHKSDKFNIEKAIYTEWARLIEENIKPDFLLSGHLHEAFISEVGGERDDYIPQPATLIVGSDKGADFHTGCGIILKRGNAPIIEFYKGTK